MGEGHIAVWHESHESIPTRGITLSTLLSVMATANPEEEKRSLIKLLTQAQVAAEVQTFITDTLTLTRTADFAKYWTKDTYEQGVHDDVVNKLDHLSNPRIQTARMRLAWETANATVNLVTAAGTSSRPPVDWDAPLDPDDKKQQLDDFVNIYHLTLDPEVSPNDNMFGRNYKEFKRGCKSVENLLKIRSAAQFTAVVGAAKRQNLGGGVALVQEDQQTSDLPDRDLSTVTKVLLAVKIMVNGWALTGTTLKDSKKVPGEKVREAELSDCQGYFDFIHLQCLVHPGPPRSTAEWILERDRQTRCKARLLYLNGWPWGEAVRESWEKECAVLWQCATLGVALAPEPNTADAASMSPLADMAHSRGSGVGTKTPRTPAPENYGQEEPCSDFNTIRGCTHKAVDCPNGKPHRCNQQLPGGGICNVWRHCARYCPHNPAKERSKKDAKRERQEADSRRVTKRR